MPGNYKLFILDDDQPYAELLVEVARDQGWQVEFDTNPLNFLQREMDSQSVLVLDLFMPEIDGIEVIRSLAERSQKIPLILVSGFDNKVLHSAQQLAEAHNIKVISTLTKPFKMQDFVALLDEVKHDYFTHEYNHESVITFSKQELETALLKDEFTLHYQPQFDINTRKIISVEALVRWQHPELGLVFPDKFINLAEEYGLVELMTRKVLTYAARDLSTLERSGFELGMAVNVTAENITSLFLPEQLKKLMDESDISPDKLTLELTESAVMGKLTSSLDVLNRLRMKGFHLSIDDFGTGYSSLQQLYQAPFNELKIDRTFVSNLMRDKEALVIVKICITLARMLNMKSLAEGVESVEILEQLRQFGCDMAQGYYLSKPLDFESLVSWLVENNHLQQRKNLRIS